MSTAFLRLAAAALAASLAVGPVQAQAPSPHSRPEAGEPARPAAEARGQERSEGRAEGRSEGRAEGRARPEGLRLPADSVTEHELALPDRTLRFRAVAGSVVLPDRAGKPEAEIGVVSYTLAGGDPARRPVTFFLNGGPGASSAYLHLGVAGPWRLPVGVETIVPSQSPALVANAETWLDFTDLVFIDPVGTGYSRLVESTDALRERYLSVEGDIAALADVITRWLKANDRMLSPKFFVGESYGGFRGPLLADKLQTDQGIGLSGLTLLSPVLDFGWRSQPAHAPLPRVSLLPSLAAAAMEKRGETANREALREVEAYASGEYVTDLLRGVQDEAAVRRITERVTRITGLDPELVRRLGGQFDIQTFARELYRGEGRLGSLYDTGVTGFDPAPNAAQPRAQDPVLDALTAPLNGAIVDHLSRTLKWRPDGQYQVLNGGINGAWRWGRGRGQPEAVSELRSVLALDPALRVLVVHGLTDLVTPYFESELILRQIRAFPQAGRVRLATYPGGHMFYTREASRAAFRADAAELYRAALEQRGMPAK